jgi:hypothetical protein
VLLVEFLQDEERSGTHECVGWRLGGDDGFEMAIARVKATEQVEDLARFGDGVADGTKLIGEAL